MICTNCVSASSINPNMVNVNHPRPHSVNLPATSSRISGIMRRCSPLIFDWGNWFDSNLKEVMCELIEIAGTMR